MREGRDNQDSRDSAKKGGARGRRAKRKICAFCMDKSKSIDYKDTYKLKKYITERGKILPRRISGNCAKHQRALGEAVKRSRNIALLPFSTD